MEFYSLHPNKIEIINILNIGRASTMFVQGLLDNHPEIITIVGLFNIPEELSGKSFDQLSDEVYDLIGEQVRFYFNYFDFEKEIKKDKFSKHLKEYIDRFGMDKKTLFIGSNYAIAKCLGKNISKIRYVLAHSHTPRFFINFSKTFSKQKIIVCVKDPRASYLSSKRKDSLIPFFSGHVNSISLYNRLNNKNPENILTIKHEILHTEFEKIKSDLCSFLKIKDLKSLNQSTFFHKPFTGASGSANAGSTNNFKSSYASKDFVSNSWEKQLSILEIQVIEFMFSKMMRFFRYRKYRSQGDLRVIFMNTGYDGFSLRYSKYRKGLRKGLFNFLYNLHKITFIGPLFLKMLFAIHILKSSLGEYIHVQTLELK